MAAGSGVDPDRSGHPGDAPRGLPAAWTRSVRPEGVIRVGAPDRSADVLLRDGTTVHLRQIRPEDAPAIVAMHARFSERTRYLRYFSPYPRIPERDLQRFVNVDHHDREAFVVIAGDRIVAV